jgi:putative nucleotide binding protein
MKEEHVIVLDYLSRGYSSSYTGEPIAQTVGTNYFTLLEIVPRDKISLKLGQTLYVGEKERKEVKFIKGRIYYDKLTNTARSELTGAVEGLVKEKEDKFVQFFNKAGSLSIRKHSLELLPSIGKEHAKHIIEAREKKPFQSFKDVTERVRLMPDPARVVSERIVEELEGTGVKYYLFTLPPKKTR